MAASATNTTRRISSAGVSHLPSLSINPCGLKANASATAKNPTKNAVEAIPEDHPVSGTIAVE